MSSARAVNLFTRTPGPGCSSYRVTAGPKAKSTTVASTPKLARVRSSSAARSRISSSESPLSVSGRGSSSREGRW